MKAVSAKCGHVKRKLIQGKRLNGEVLEFALSVLPDEKRGSSSSDELLDRIRQKLLSGHQLDEYEYHVFVEVILLHVRLSVV